ncbi:MAG: hypothetical protein R6U84_06335 [Candidatus Cloacimonadales bacterium]
MEMKTRFDRAQDEKRIATTFGVCYGFTRYSGVAGIHKYKDHNDLSASGGFICQPQAGKPLDDWSWSKSLVA